MGDPRIDSLHDPYEEQLSAARYKAERDAAMQELQAMRERNIELWMESGMANELVTCAEQKAERLGKLVWRLQNRLARAHRREKALRKGMREWREKVMGAPVRTVSAYDLLPEEDLQTLRWVMEQGGLSDVRLCHNAADNRRVELCGALGIDLETGWSDAMAAMRPRLMPEGMEWLVEAWPRFEDGEPVKFGDAFRDHQGSTRSVLNVKMWQEGGFELGTGQGTYDWHECGERVNRPAKVLDADGVEVELGDDLYSVEGSSKFHVSHVDRANGKIATDAMFALDKWADPKMYTHRATVLAADGKPIRVGDTVWCTNGHGPFEVTSIVYADNWRVVCDSEEIGHLNVFPESITHRAPVLAADGKPIREGETVWSNGGGVYRVTSVHDGKVFARHVGGSFVAEVESAGGDGLYRLRADRLAHERSDSWERLEEDATISPEAYCVKRGIDFSDVDGQHRVLDEVTERMARDLVRRCKELARKENNNE